MDLDISCFMTICAGSDTIGLALLSLERYFTNIEILIVLQLYMLCGSGCSFVI